MAGLYVHIPFCESRCIYCGFYSTTERDSQYAYVEALLKEMHMRRDYLQGEALTTVYLGGGTPSTLTEEMLTKLCNAVSDTFGTSAVEEWTMECNPDDVTPEFAETLRQLPVNRVSMGVQTFDAERLRWLRRRHTPEQVTEAVRLCRNAGIRNISLDLMFGFPGQRVEDVHEDVRSMVALKPEHISAYSLMYEEGTALWRKLEKGEIAETSDEEYLRMYNIIIDSLYEAGYEQYEISNFALPHHRSRHNSSYWRAVPYLGIGAAAHSYNKVSREWNVSNLQEYIASINRGVLPSEREELDADTRYNDLVTTALRTREGIDLNALTPEYRSYILREAQPHINNGNLAIDGDSLHLTRQGLFISDTIMSDIVKV